VFAENLRKTVPPLRDARFALRDKRLGVFTFTLTIISPKPRRSNRGIPLLSKRILVPDSTPSGIFKFTQPDKVGISILSPSAACEKEIDRS